MAREKAFSLWLKKGLNSSEPLEHFSFYLQLLTEPFEAAASFAIFTETNPLQSFAL